MWVHHQGQVLRFATYGQGQVTMDGEAITAGVSNGFHRSHLARIDPRALFRQFLQVVGGAVVAVVGPWVTVAAGPHQELGLGIILSIYPVFQVFEFRSEFAVHGFGLLVQEHPLALRAGPRGHGEHLALLAVADALHVVVLVVGDHLDLFLAREVPLHDGALIAAVQVVVHVKVGVVEGEHLRCPLVLEAGGHVKGERLLLVGAIVDVGVHAIGLRGHADHAVVVGDPAFEVLLAVVVHGLALTGHDVHQVGVEHLRIALVHLHHHALFHARHLIQVVHHPGAHPFLRCKGLHVLAIDAGAEHDEILVAIDVAAVKDAVTFPEVTTHVANGVCRHLHGGAVTHLLHEDVHAVLPRGPVADVLAIGTDAETSLFRVLEEVFHGDGRRRGRLCLLRLLLVTPAAGGEHHGASQQGGQAEGPIEVVGHFSGFVPRCKGVIRSRSSDAGSMDGWTNG